MTLFRTALVASTMLVSLASASAFAAELTEERVKEIVKQYIQGHPEDVVNALQNWQIKEEANRVIEQQKAVKELGTTTFNDPSFPIAGNAKGDVTLVEFFDYNCPACKMMFESLDALIEQDKNVRVVFVEYPIFGPASDENAKLAMAVHTLAPTKYYEFHETIMRNKGKVDAAYLLNVAKGLGVDPEKLKTEAQKPIYNEQIANHREIAQKLQIRGTPALVVGETMVNSALSLDDLKQQVRMERSVKK